jgi:hypothetical protein
LSSKINTLLILKDAPLGSLEIYSGITAFCESDKKLNNMHEEHGGRL